MPQRLTDSPRRSCCGRGRSRFGRSAAEEAIALVAVGISGDAPGVEFCGEPVGRLPEESRLGLQLRDACPCCRQLLVIGGDVAVELLVGAAYLPVRREALRLLP